ncbi:MAG: succinate dehydrogenase assembly factor 2 [Proteobacteria bacterium]|nr:succinate dehydrogenase assembly factor 2 [Pseudomonadota bacterium]
MSDEIKMNKIEHERLRWACRRGMLELDLFLVPFFEACYATLNLHQQQSFAHLLTATDPELLSWLMGHSFHENKEVQEIVEQIRNYRLQQRQHPIL